MAAEASAFALPITAAVGIVGAGAMGAGIAQVAATAGHPVLLFDTRRGAADGVVQTMGQTLARLVTKGRLSDSEAHAIRTRVVVVTHLRDLATCGLIVEAIVEDLEAKRALFAELEAIVDDHTLLATNTSSISVTAIGRPLRLPHRLAGMHFFNPAPVMPLVEIVSGLATSASTANMLSATAQSWGKTPVSAKSSPGFIVNRVARPFYGESLRVLHEGGADCATIDAVLRDVGGFRMGPFELMDLIGNDVNYAVTCSVFDGFYGDARFTPSPLQRALVDAGRLGRKSGQGFYTYGDTANVAQPHTLPAYPLPGAVAIFGDTTLGAVLLNRLQGSHTKVTVVPAHADGRVAACDDVVLFTCDGTTATARAASCGPTDVALVDLALDYAATSRVALAVSDQSNGAALPAAAGILQAAGYAVSAIDDVPGMIVLRTVAMLINEAADAVNQGVCTASDCDLAMRKGVNYPRGPLAWGDALGLRVVVTALDNMRAAYGEDRYRVSSLLRRSAQAGHSFFPAGDFNDAR